MPHYRRWHKDYGVYFFTLVTHGRRGILVSDTSRNALHEAITQTIDRLPFNLDAIVLMPDHLHLLMRLPPGDEDYSSRITKIKRNFTETYLLSGGTEGASTPSRLRQRYRGVWQKRYYEHCIRGYKDFKLHLDYIHINPVRHGLVQLPQDWKWSSFHRWVKQGEYGPDWCGHVTLPGGADIEPDTW